MDQQEYTDPQCPFDTSMWQKNAPVRRIPAGRVLEKEDELLSRKDYAGAERILLYWLQEAGVGGDLRGAFLLENELMGLYRKEGRKEEAYRHMDAALKLSEAPEIGAESTGAATAFLNAATVCKAFSEPEKALPLYEKARELYERLLPPDDERLAGLFNNYGLALTDVKRFSEAETCYQKALSILEGQPYGAPDQAITLLNLCDLYFARDVLLETDPDTGEMMEILPEKTEETIQEHLSRAEKYLLEGAFQSEGYKAFVYEKCAPSLDFYGHFFTAGELRRISEEIYQRGAE